MNLRRVAIIAAAVLAIAGAAVVYSHFDPSESAWFPRCPILTLTGLKCPGCGSQRMIHALLHGDIAAAWHHNAMLLALLPLIVILIVVEPFRSRWPRLYMMLNSRWLILAVFAALAVWTVGRNI